MIVVYIWIFSLINNWRSLHQTCKYEVLGLLLSHLRIKPFIIFVAVWDAKSHFSPGTSAIISGNFHNMADNIDHIDQPSPLECSGDMDNKTAPAKRACDWHDWCRICSCLCLSLIPATGAGASIHFLISREYPWEMTQPKALIGFAVLVMTILSTIFTSTCCYVCCYAKFRQRENRGSKEQTGSRQTRRYVNFLTC